MYSNNRSMPSEDVDGFNRDTVSHIWINIPSQRNQPSLDGKPEADTPKTNRHILRCSQNTPCLGWTPCEAIAIAESASDQLVTFRSIGSPFPLLPSQPDIRLALTTPLRFTRMFCPIKHEDFACHRFCRNQVGILWHVTRSVDFSCMIDLLNDSNSGYWRDGVSTQFFSLVIVVSAVEFVGACRWMSTFGYLDLSDL